MYNVVGTAMRPPKAVRVLIPRTCGYVTLQSKKDFASVIKLKTLRQEDYPGLSGWLQSNQRALERGRGR